MLAYEVIQAFDLPIPIVGKVKRREFGNRNFILVAARFFIRQPKENGRHAFLRFPDAFHCGQFGGLVFHRVQAVQVTRNNLQRNQKRSQVHTGFDTRHHLCTTITPQPAVA